MTLQIAWSGAVAVAAEAGRRAALPDPARASASWPTRRSLNGARGLNFFGGHLTQVARPADARAGWNWTFWEQVLRPLVRELVVDRGRARARRPGRDRP